MERYPFQKPSPPSPATLGLRGRLAGITLGIAGVGGEGVVSAQEVRDETQTENVHPRLHESREAIQRTERAERLLFSVLSSGSSPSTHIVRSQEMSELVQAMNDLSRGACDLYEERFRPDNAVYFYVESDKDAQRDLRGKDPFHHESQAEQMMNRLVEVSSNNRVLSLGHVFFDARIDRQNQSNASFYSIDTAWARYVSDDEMRSREDREGAYRTWRTISMRVEQSQSFTTQDANNAYQIQRAIEGLLRHGADKTAHLQTEGSAGESMGLLRSMSQAYVRNIHFSIHVERNPLGYNERIIEVTADIWQ